MRYAKGIMWLDDCRIPFTDEGDMKATTEAKYTIGEGKISELGFGLKKMGNFSKETGRFTPNLLVCDDMLNDGTISKSSDNKWFGGKRKKNWEGHTNNRNQTYSDKGSNSRYYDLDKWFDKLINEL